MAAQYINLHNQFGNEAFGTFEHYNGCIVGSIAWKGGLNLTWNINNDISATFMYRYYINKLGADGYGDIFIYRLAYNL
ncbi:hypothetical protein ACWX0P_29245 [Vibrio mediterranei]